MVVLLLVAGALISVFLPRIFHYSHSSWKGDPFAGREIRCAINIGRFDDSTRILITGYNYELLKEFARDIGSTATIIPVRDRSGRDPGVHSDRQPVPLAGQG